MSNSVLSKAGVTTLALLCFNAPVLATVVNFSDPVESERWFTVVDGVMGGHSSGEISFNGKYAVFEGNLSLRNNGGFSSVRRMWPTSNEGRNSVQIQVLGDGREYQLRMYKNRWLNGIAYGAKFKTEPGKLQTLTFTQQDFKPKYFGRLVRNAPDLELDQVQQVGFMLADKQAGEFALKIKSVSMH